MNPNLLLLVADDLGYADLGSYGSDIDTPNLDHLAARGIRFSRFYTYPLCAPTRAALLSGTDSHVAGMGAQGRQTDYWGYEGHLTDRIVPIPQLLKQAGYHTYMAGKWHLAGKQGQLPPSKGFERSFVLHQGASNHYNNTGLTSQDSISDYSVDGKPTSWPEGHYSTKVYTDSLMAYIREGQGDGQPFFAYGAYTSPHWPLQVGESFWRKYEGRYDEGYQALRKQRLASLKDAGIIAGDVELPPMNPAVEPWAQLSPREKKREARKMELYAGMLNNLDFHVGRLIRFLKNIGEYENTVIVFLSDNGAAGEDFYNHPDFKDFLRSRYDNSYQDMGSPSSFVSYGRGWAEAGSAPFRLVKGYTYEGGIAAPMIISGPDVSGEGRVYDGFSTVMDIAPTLYEIAGVSYPSSHDGTSLYPLQGTSLLPILTGTATQVHALDETWVIEHAGHALVRIGPWKLVRKGTFRLENPGKRWDESDFRLYNLAVDGSEKTDLKAEHPGKFQELMKVWKNYRKEYKIRESF